jgi:WD40-like Beta Propeller Repeat
VTELARMRRAYDAIEEPNDETVSAAREVLLGEIGSSERPRPSRPERRWVFAAIAAAILIGGLLVTPAFGIGGRLLDLIQSAPARPEARTPVWSPDGRRIAFTSRRDGNWEVYVVNADGSGQRRLTRNAAGDFAPTWSPDGRKIVFERRRDVNPMGGGLYVVNADGSGQRRLTRDGQDAPAWSPDGRRSPSCGGSASTS